jgi:hypothetical protein
MIRAIIKDSSMTRYYSDHIKPEIIFQPVLVTNTFNINWNFQADHNYSNFNNYMNVNFIDSVIMFSYYSNDVSIFVNNPIIAYNIPNSSNYGITYQLDSTLMKNNYALYYKIYAVDKGIVPEHSTSPDTGYHKLVYDTTFVSVEEDENIIREYSLAQNYPNPFNPATTIKFSIAEEGLVNLSVYNLLGQKAAELKNEVLQPGNYEAEFDASSLSSGVYVYKLSAGGKVISRKMVVLK